MSDAPPTFAVVGHTNEGKSSVVSTLAADDTVRIASAARTTTECREYPVRIDGETVFNLVDTPGFENARQMLAWLTARQPTADRRPQAVADFLLDRRDDPSFSHEHKLLAPIMRGAGILYVIDASHPFRARYEAEMEILRWTGQPRLALINDKDAGQYLEDWKAALNQYFSLVRYFNAHRSTFDNRIALLEALREVRDDWREAIGRAVSALRMDWARRRRDAAAVIARMLAAVLTHVEDVALSGDGGALQAAVESRFHDALRDLEVDARRTVERLYGHTLLERDEDQLERPILERDLFAEETWKVLGLSNQQLLWTGALGGAAVGGSLDAVVGGASMLMGTVLGTMVGAGSAWWLSSRRYASAVTTLRALRGDRILRVGPHRNPQLPWVVLDRALLHYAVIANRAHSNREVLRMRSGEGTLGVVSRLSDDTRKHLERLFRDLRRAGPGGSSELRDRLRDAIDGIMTGA
ncbi:MAG: GTPase/DUF3482 domain-containing protein [Candidatus Schekmanbacteria bacterium]|nr:GTPase/DUF3482 domain-containing protein [Candidatus Schekmanbacteria bacterium]